MKPLGPFLGMNNRLPAEKLRVKDGDFVTNAVNGDFTLAGTFRRRPGFAPALVASNAHSLTEMGGGFMVDGSQMYRLSKGVDGVLARTAIAAVTPNLQFSYAAAPLAIYASNGREFFRITDTEVFPVGLPSPDQPVVRWIPGGSLPAGVYQVATSFRDGSAGRDSGVSMAARVELLTEGTIVLDWTHQITGADTRLYMTTTNGDTLFEVGEVQGTIAALPHEGARPVAHLTAPLPAGQIIRHHLGKLYSASGNYLFYSEAYGLELCDLAENCIPFPQPITLVEPCINGLYISADKTYWLDTATYVLTPVLPYRAVAGSGNVRRDAEEVWWMSERGIVRGDKAGNVENMQEENVAVSPAQFGASMMREEDGEKQLVVSSFGSQTTVTASRTWMEAEVIRKETTI